MRGRGKNRREGERGGIGERGRGRNKREGKREE